MRKYALIMVAGLLASGSVVSASLFFDDFETGSTAKNDRDGWTFWSISNDQYHQVVDDVFSPWDGSTRSMRFFDDDAADLGSQQAYSDLGLDEPRTFHPGTGEITATFDLGIADYRQNIFIHLGGMQPGGTVDRAFGVQVQHSTGLVRANGSDLLDDATG